MAQLQIDEFDLQVHVVARSVGTEPVTVEQATTALTSTDKRAVYVRQGGVEYEITSAGPIG
jgi:hypothetical protein